MRPDGLPLNVHPPDAQTLIAEQLARFDQHSFDAIVQHTRTSTFVPASVVKSEEGLETGLDLARSAGQMERSALSADLAEGRAYAVPEVPGLR